MSEAIIGIEQAEMESRLRRLEDIVARFSVYASRYQGYKKLFEAHRDADVYIREFSVKTPLSMSVTEIVEERMNHASSALANGDLEAYQQICRGTTGITYGDIVKKGKK